jgi:hypothetical protein
MQGVWKDVGVLYQELKSNNPANVVELCGCLNNYFIEEIHQELNKISSNLRRPNACVAGCAIIYFTFGKI